MSWSALPPRGTLAAGVAVPFLYFGTQLVAAPFNPGYSFLSQTASMLGSDRATHPGLFNMGVGLTGLATLVAAAGYFCGFRALNAPVVLRWLVFLALEGLGLATLNAARFPLPDPRHGSGPLIAGAVLLPALLLAALWRQPEARPLRGYLLVTNGLLLALVPVMSGWSGLDVRGLEGLLQRLVALVIYPPIAVGAWFLAKQLRRGVTPSASYPPLG
ncbi:DUF998 domain-containing protein [Myxococcus sp. K15C18031901]|uniref:DUF998 domain-containing protein n=1 Tax=Myxococcus dinghuensis TaxID=2906761 RepID=UPI0020A7C6C9|nr:DUF998 domain-containing protein [Myxococcus dinghuensis]MCP3100920.1 DUF998 domain-containing protein [Myxococcus dinghuensis]